MMTRRRLPRALETLSGQWERNGLEVPAARAEQFLNQNLSARLEGVLQAVTALRGR